MEYMYSFDNNFLRSSTICCELVVKIKQYINILQIEASRLRGLQLECNELLDQFYPSKNEFDFLVKEVLQLKYFGEEDFLSIPTFYEEFSLFIKSVWQVGKYKFLEKGKNTKYVSFVGSPLAEVTTTIESFVDEIQLRLTYMPYHSECANTMHSICNQIVEELKGEGLNTAETCIRQYIYLQAALPFLQQLKSLINQYLLATDVHTPKEFVQRIIFQIPSVDGLRFEEDCIDMAPFRFTVDLLNGKLLDSDVLDHNSDIKPVVEDDSNLKRSMIVIETVNWIMQQYKTDNVPRAFKNFVVPAGLMNRKKSFNPEVNTFASPMSARSLRALNSSPFDVNDLSNSDWFGTSNSPTAFNRRVNRRGRRSESSTVRTSQNQSNDLQPILLHTLQSPILRPLL